MASSALCRARPAAPTSTARPPCRTTSARVAPARPTATLNVELSNDGPKPQTSTGPAYPGDQGEPTGGGGGLDPGDRPHLGGRRQPAHVEAAQQRRGRRRWSGSAEDGAREDEAEDGDDEGEEDDEDEQPDSTTASTAHGSSTDDGRRRGITRTR